MHLLLIGICLALLPLLLSAAYRAVFALTYLLRAPRSSPPAPVHNPFRFAALIPAHDEEMLIGEVIESIKACEYPADYIDIYVVADNCTDETADRARRYGATALERSDSQNRGKGQALAWLIARIDLPRYDALAMFDADNLVEPAFFDRMARELLDGGRCLQGYYGVSNPHSSMLTRMLSVTYVMKNLLYNAGKRATGLSVSLMGTGMVFARDVIEQHGWRASSVAEDLEQSINLIEAGESIRFVSDARIRAQESADLRTGYTQRQRWSSGRRALKQRAWRLVFSPPRSCERIDMGFDLLLPAYSTLLNASILLLPLSWLASPTSGIPLLLNLMLLAYQVIEVTIAYRIMGARPKDFLSLAYAPVFLVWKGLIDVLALFGVQKTAWIRTKRSRHSPPQQ